MKIISVVGSGRLTMPLSPFAMKLILCFRSGNPTCGSMCLKTLLTGCIIHRYRKDDYMAELNVSMLTCSLHIYFMRQVALMISLTEWESML
jgi:uncharacterized membrane protein YbaN (DUF454 family)